MITKIFAGKMIDGQLAFFKGVGEGMTTNVDEAYEFEDDHLARFICAEFNKNDAGWFVVQFSEEA